MTQAEKRRKLLRIVPGLQTSDGAGVKLLRSIGSSQNIRLDPFLMLDEFGTENPDDYIAGFPPHPHRGFQSWVNLPAKEKMKPAAYWDIPKAEITVLPLENGGSVKLVADPASYRSSQIP